MKENIKNAQEVGKLYIVATPIGNLEDMTLRALRILKEVDLIACEDTRVTSKLLAHYSISKSLTSLHHHSGKVQFDKIIAELEEGKGVAFVSDAGTPGVSDPGNKLVEEVLVAGYEVVPIPGVSALATIISVAGVDMQSFSFFGFPPHKKGRETFFKKVSASDIPAMYYESPHRVLKNLQLLKEFAPQKKIILGRELTKMFEQVVRGSIDEVLQYFTENPTKVKGEFVVIVY